MEQSKRMNSIIQDISSVGRSGLHAVHPLNNNDLDVPHPAELHHVLRLLNGAKDKQVQYKNDRYVLVRNGCASYIYLSVVENR